MIIYTPAVFFFKWWKDICTKFVTTKQCSWYSFSKADMKLPLKNWNSYWLLNFALVQSSSESAILFEGSNTNSGAQRNKELINNDMSVQPAQFSTIVQDYGSFIKLKVNGADLDFQHCFSNLQISWLDTCLHILCPPILL